MQSENVIKIEEISVSLPDSWDWISLGETGEYINGFPFKPSHRENGGLPIIRIQNLTDRQKPFNRTTIEVPAEYHVMKGDMLVSWSATLDVFLWHGEPALVNQHIFKVLPDTRIIHHQLLFYWLKIAIPQLLDTEHLHGSTMKHINRGPFLAYKIPLPPFPEQTRIVAKLEELLSDLDAGVEELKEAQKKLAQYRQSLLKAAVEGALTAEWRKLNQPEETGGQLLQRILKERRAHWEAKQLVKFKDQDKPPPKDWQAKYSEPVQPDVSNLPELPEGWVWATMDQMAIEQKYGSSAKTNEDKTGVPVLRMGNIQDGELDWRELKYLPITHDEFPCLYLKDGDLLFNRTNSPELVGKTAVYRSHISPCSYASYLISVRLSDYYIPELASAYINSIHGRLWVKSVVTQQVGQANVNGTKLAALAIPIPPFEEQKEIAKLLDELRSASSEQIKNVEFSLHQTAAQRKNILKAAFSGQLVPQDPDDEPASVLLERIRDERAKQTKTHKSRSGKVSA